MPSMSAQNLEELTIRDLFALPLESPPELAAGLEPKDFESLHRKLTALAEPVPWSRLQSEVAGQVSAALSTGLLDAWATAWKKYQDVQADVEESRKSPEATVLSRLAEHSIDSTLHPSVEVFLGPAKLEKITFDVTLTTEIRGLILGLKDGRLISIQVAQCEWTGSISVKGITLVERKLAKLDIPGRITFKRPVSLLPN